MYVVIGGRGYLGSYIIKSIETNTKDKIIATARNIDNIEMTERIEWVNCDITKDTEFDNLVAKISGIDNIKVIFLAAYHNPDLVAANPELAWDINVTALSKCVNKLRFVDKLFYASTDSVYGNSKDGYHFRESDPLNPVNIYGKNKCAAEAIVRFAGFNVVRYPFLISPSLVPGKDHFYDVIVKKLSNGEEIEMFSDSYRSSLSFQTAADILIQLCELNDKCPDILNICGDDDLSKYDIGLMMADKLGINREKVIPIRVSEASGIFKTPRASSTLMDNSLVKEILNYKSIKLII